ncbi:MAG: sigma-70 family RNA polymerase sigma factor [Gemmatimonadota bacterium]
MSTWLAMTPRSRAIDRQRSRKRRRRETDLPEDEAQIPVGSASGDPLDGAETAERREIVALALGSLSTDQRQAIELAYFRGMSQSEIAEHTGDQPSAGFRIVRAIVSAAPDSRPDDLLKLLEWSVPSR